MERTRRRRSPWILGWLSLSLLALAACQPAPEGDRAAAAADTAAIRASIDSLRSGFQQAVNEGDWQRLGTMLTPDARTVLAGGAAWDSMTAAASAAGTPFPPGSRLEINTMETGVLSRDWAFDMGTSRLSWTPEGADSARTLRGTYLVLLHRTGEGWKVHREVESSRPPPQEGR